MQVNIVDFKECKVAALEHRGPIEKKLDSIVKFIEWRKINGYPPTKSATYNIFYQNSPDATPEEFHFDVCCAVDKNVAENPQNVTNKIIPGGRCAVLRHLGSSNNLEDSMEYLYRQWLPTSGEELRHFPVFVHRVKLESEESENDAITDIYLPLNNLTIT